LKVTIEIHEDKLSIISRQGTPKEVKERDALAGIAVDWANRVMRQILKHEKVESDIQIEQQLKYTPRQS